MGKIGVTKGFLSIFLISFVIIPLTLSYNSFGDSSENSIMGQLVIALVDIFITCLLDIVFDIVRRNSVLVTHVNQRVRKDGHSM